MTETVATPKKSKSAAKAKKPKSAPSHPKVADMVNAAIQELKERGGSSLQAIKKYISANYKVDADKLAPFIKKYLRSAVVSGGLVQTKGKGASGSFRMGGPAASGGAKKAAKPKKAVAKPKKAVGTPKKVAKPKKSPAKSKPKKATPVKAKSAAAKKAKPVKVKVAPKKKPAKSSPKKKAAPKKAKK